MTTKYQPGMKQLLIVTAVIEVGAGATLFCCPSMMARLLLASPLTTSATHALGRIAGVALIALGLANCLARHEDQSLSTRGLVTSMVVYNLGAVVILSAYGCRSQTVGVALWLAVIIHAVMAVWCLKRLSLKQLQAIKESQPKN